MRKLLALVLALSILPGCTGKRHLMDRAMVLRAELLACENCSFDAKITADYGDELHEFTMYCTADNDGNLSFSVEKPESIEGITGKIASGEGKLTFDDTVLYFPLMADEQITPISAPWILVKTLLGGYLTGCCEEDGLLRLSINDSYEEDALQMEIWMDGEDAPVNAEIYYDDRRIVTMEIENFQIR